MAARYWIGGGTNSNWNASPTTNWAATSGGAVRVAIPTSADDVFFDGAGASGNTNSTISATITCKSLTITAGYTATMTHNAVLTVAGNWNYSNTYTIAGSSGLTQSAAGTITSGQTWPNALTFSSTATRTLVNNLVVTGLVTGGGGFTLNKTTSEILKCNGGFTSSGGISFAGTSKIVFGGGTCSSTTRFDISCDIDGTCTIGNLAIGTSTFTYISGTITITGGTTLTIGGSGSSTGVLNVSSVTWNNVTFSSSGTTTWTLTSDLNINGLLTIGTQYAVNKTTSEKITVAGGLTNSGVLGSIGGTAEIIMTGGTWTGSTTSGVFSPLTFNGNVTLSANCVFGNNTIKYLSGTITTTGNTLGIANGSTTFDTNGITWNNITLSNTSAYTYTINSTLTINGVLTLGTGATTIFAGTAGFTCATLSQIGTGATTITLKESVTYTVTSAITCNTTRVGSILTFTSAHASTKAILTLNNGATCAVLANFTRIDASGGRPIRSFNGTITDCNNIISITDLPSTGTSITFQ